MPAKDRKPDIDVKAIRETLNLSQDELARALCVAKLTVQRWEHSKASPSPMAVDRLEEMLKAKEQRSV